MLGLVLVLVIVVAALGLRAAWKHLTGEEAAAAQQRAGVPGRGGAEDPRADGLHRRHRWSDPRPGLELTPGGIRYTGREVRFCLDCPAEMSARHPSAGTGFP